MPSPSIPRFNPEAHEAAQREAAMKFLNGFFDAFDSLTSKVEALAENDPELQEAVTAFQHAEDSIGLVLSSPNTTITLLPRSSSPEDKIKVIPGEHGGVSLQIVTKDGIITRVNFYGGLRDPKHSSDQFDRDLSLRHQHSKRTDSVVSKPTQLNLHMYTPGQSEPFMDVWIVSNPKQIQLTSFKFEEKYDVYPVMKDTEYGFKKIASSLYSSMRDLMLMVPNPYSPR